MAWIFGVVAVTLGVVLLWGIVAPRSQWWALVAWSVADPHKHEPGAGAYGVRRLVSALGVLALAAVVVISGASMFPRPSAAASSKTAIEEMWGSPNPQIVNRDVATLAAPPAGLLEVPVLDYEGFVGKGTPPYLTGLRTYSYLGNPTVAGLIGAAPDKGFSAVDTAALVVHVRGPILCIPRAAVVIETDTTVQIAIYYGLPDSADGSPVDHLAGCTADAPVTASLLIPIRLVGALGDREVQALDGTAITSVELVDSGS